jgi:hypothetical protein
MRSKRRAARSALRGSPAISPLLTIFCTGRAAKTHNSSPKRSADAWSSTAYRSLTTKKKPSIGPSAHAVTRKPLGKKGRRIKLLLGRVHGLTARPAPPWRGQHFSDGGGGRRGKRRELPAPLPSSPPVSPHRDRRSCGRRDSEDPSAGQRTTP